METWFLDERLWEATRGFLFSEERWRAAGAEVDAILERVGIDPPADPDDDLRVLRNPATSLRPGGALVLDLMGKEFLARIFQRRDWKEIDGELWLFERSVSDAWSWIENRWIRIRDAEREEFTASHRLYAASELGDRLRECGFVGVEAYGGLEWTPYDEAASRLVLRARRGS